MWMFSSLLNFCFENWKPLSIRWNTWNIVKNSWILMNRFRHRIRFLCRENNIFCNCCIVYETVHVYNRESVLVFILVTCQKPNSDKSFINGNGNNCNTVLLFCVIFHSCILFWGFNVAEFKWFIKYVWHVLKETIYD